MKNALLDQPPHETGERTPPRVRRLTPSSTAGVRLRAHFDVRCAWIPRLLVRAALLPLCLLSAVRACANPTGGTVAQGSATFSSSGSTFNINQSSGNAVINWQSFNIGAGETVNFNQPSATSVTWNQINDPNPSQILGSLNANGYIILQNASGFVVGGQASINVHGLVMTTASTPVINFSSGDPWSFDTPPPTAKIVNYGRINISGGGSAYLIADDVENNGTISAPGGTIGLYAGEKVLVSMSPDGRGLSAEATIPQGMVGNNGELVANAGKIALQAQMVNQNGVIQANSAQDVNGAIELIAGDSVNLGANSEISARGDSQGVSSGGSVTIQGGNSFSDQAGSTINVAGGAQGGNGGDVELSAPQMGDIATTINGQAADGFAGGILTIDPNDVWLDTYNSVPPGSDYSFVPLSSFNGMSTINVQADNNIVLNTGWYLPDQSQSATLSLTAGNSITLNDGSYIQAGQNWTLNLSAGAAYSGITPPASGQDGIYLDGGAYLQTQNGDINLWAANEVEVGWSGSSAGAGVANLGTGGITTQNGGNVNVTAEFGDVNSGSSQYGFDYYSDPNAPCQADASLGGIGTANGGNVNIYAGGNVISYSASIIAQNPNTDFINPGDPDPGTGAFGSAPGNVTINAGGDVYGCFVVMNGQGNINARNIGTSDYNVALSLATGGWNLDALNSIYLQEVRNPNGLYNTTTVSRINHNPSAANHLFDYDPQASVSLNAGNAVNITGFALPRPDGAVPLLLPPVVSISAGPGGVALDTPAANDISGPITDFQPDITLFPSIYQSLDISTTGGGWLSSGNANGLDANLLMSDSGDTTWFVSNSGIQPFSENDHASVPLELDNDNPVTIDLSGSQLVNGSPIAAGMENLILQTDKAARINVAGDMIGCTFYGENLHPGDVTSITVGGQIYNPGSFTSVTLSQDFPTLPAQDTPLPSELSELTVQGVSLDSWYLPLLLAVDSKELPSLANLSLDQMLSEIKSAELFQTLNFSSLIYNPDTRTLTSIGPMSSDLADALESPTLTFVRFDSAGFPVANNGNGQAVTDKIPWANSANASLIASLNTESQGSVPLGTAAAGAYIVGGTGSFDINAGSIALGSSYGILSVGSGNAPVGPNYSYLAPYAASAANIDVNAGTLEMPASTIACLAPGGSVTVTASGEIPNSGLNENGIGVSMDLGSQELLPFESQIMSSKKLGLGIYTTGGGDVNVTALGTINVDSSRIATFDGGDITVESFTGDVNAGSGGSVAVPVSYFASDFYGADLEDVPANGIVAATLTGGRTIPPGADLLPGNITVDTPEGSIYASSGGISQWAYNEILTASSGTASVTLDAGSDGYIGNLNLGNSGVIGINVNASASGNINGLIIAEGNANINAIGDIAGTIFSGGVTTIGSGGTVSGTIVAAGGLNTSGGNISASIFTTSVNGGAGTLATSTTASSATQSAANQTSSLNQQQVASSGTDDDKKKKKKAELHTIGRVTVILPKSS